MSSARRFRRATKRAPERFTRRNTLLGLFYLLFRFLGAKGLLRKLIRKPWHVADLYCDGRFVQALYAFKAPQTRK